MNVEINKIGTDTEIILESRLDAVTSSSVDEIIQKEIDVLEGSLIINLKNVDYVSSMGLRTFVAAYKKMNGKKMILSNANTSVKEVIKMTGLSSLFVLE